MRNWAVLGCTNNTYTLEKWQQTKCKIHKCLHHYPDCTCEVHFFLYSFPSERWDPEGRRKWISCINRRDPHNREKIWKPERHSCVCSYHFKGKKNPLQLQYMQLIYSQWKSWVMMQNMSHQEPLQRKELEQRLLVLCPLKLIHLNQVSMRVTMRHTQWGVTVLHSAHVQVVWTSRKQS